MHITGVRGIILEEVILYRLEMVGYRIVKAGEEETENGHSGLEVQGRGEKHQIDALAAFDHTPPFMYPVRLMVEAKCYAPNNTVGIDVVRNSVGVLKDISENYFTYNSATDDGHEIKAQRYNYCSAVFSTSGYTSGAISYAIAHQIFLIQYENVWHMRHIIPALLAFNEDGLVSMNQVKLSKKIRQELRRYFGVLPAGGVLPDDGDVCPFTESGYEYLKENIIKPLFEIKGSYFGMLQGRWPIHLLSSQPLPPELFVDSDVVSCKVYGRIGGTWSFVPLDHREGDALWFRLSFDLPKEVAKLVDAANGNLETVAGIKTRHFSYISLSGIIGGVRRQVRLELNRDWISQYLAPAER